MKQVLILISFNLFLVGTSSAQINLLNTINQLKNTELGDKIKNSFSEKLDESRKEYDESNFNYAISFSDNAGLFETKEKGDRNKIILVEAIKAKTGEEISLEEKASNYNLTGEMFFAGNKFKSAEIAFKESIFLYKKAGKTESKEIALPINNLGLLYHASGRYTLAEETIDQALEIREKLVLNTSAHAVSVNNKAVLFKDMGKYNLAEDFIEQALAIISKEDLNSIAHAIVLNNKAMLFQAVGRYKNAEQLINQSIEIAKKTLGEKSANYVKLLVNKAILYREMEKYNEAEKIYLDAIKIKEKRLGKSHPDYAHLKRGLASLYLMMGKDKEVEGLLQTAADIYKKKFGENHPSYAATLSDLGNFYRINKKIPEATTMLSKAVDIKKDILGENHPDYVTSLEDMAIVNWQAGNMQEASKIYQQVIDKTTGYIDAYFAPMSENEKARFWSKVTPRFHRFNSFVAEQGMAEPKLISLLYNNQIKTKAMLLNSTSKMKNLILNSGNKPLIEKYAKWLDQKENLARLYSLSKEELAEEEINIDSLESETNKLEKSLSAESKSFSDAYGKEKILYTDIANVLNESEAVVEIVKFKKFNSVFTDSIFYAALILTKTNQSEPKMVLLKNGTDLEKFYIGRYKREIMSNKEDAISYLQFWAEIDKNLDKYKNLYVSLDGVYNQINLNTLLGPSKKYLIDIKNIIIIGNSKDIIQMKKTANKQTKKKTATLIGFPNYGNDGSIQELPGTKIEVENIQVTLKKNKYSVDLLLADRATEANLKAARSEIIHIATHGFFLEDVSNKKSDRVMGVEVSKAKDNPLLRSGLLLAGAESIMYADSNDILKDKDGVLNAYEAMNLSFDNTDILVLSACETGLGEVTAGEGVYGLQRAFQVAGAKSIIMSLWQVSDDATQELMSTFYKNYCLTGNKQDAFIKAQKQIKLKYPSPFYWGAFVMVGN